MCWGDIVVVSLMDEIRKILLNNSSITEIGDKQILLLSGVRPIEFCGFLFSLQKKYRLNIQDKEILGEELETLESITKYVSINRRD